MNVGALVAGVGGGLGVAYYVAKNPAESAKMAGIGVAGAVSGVGYTYLVDKVYRSFPVETIGEEPIPRNININRVTQLAGLLLPGMVAGYVHSKLFPKDGLGTSTFVGTVAALGTVAGTLLNQGGVATIGGAKIGSIAFTAAIGALAATLIAEATLAGGKYLSSHVNWK